MGENKMAEKRWMLDMLAEPVVPPWTSSHVCEQNGAELQRAIIMGFANPSTDPIWGPEHRESTFEKVFTWKEHGEYFRGAMTMASLRYAGDFVELLKRYGTIKVTIKKLQKKQE